MIFGPETPDECGVDHEVGPCDACGKVGPVGWAHICRDCWDYMPEDTA